MKGRIIEILNHAGDRMRGFASDGSLLFMRKPGRSSSMNSAIAKFQLPPDPVGKQISLGGEAPHTVAGVVKDFIIRPFIVKIGALCLVILG